MKITLNCDGASKGNPGRAGAGGVAKDQNGGILFKYSEYLGIATNNVAEYKALIIGLKKIIRIEGKKDVAVFSDSELMVRQINGIYKVKEPSLQLLIGEVLTLTREFNSFKIQHIPRGFNKEADSLANDSLK